MSNKTLNRQKLKESLVLSCLKKLKFIKFLVHWAVAVAVGILFFASLAILITINYWQTAHLNWLPHFLHNWDWLPLHLRSLKPYDAFMTRIFLLCTFCCRRKNDEKSDNVN